MKKKAIPIIITVALSVIAVLALGVHYLGNPSLRRLFGRSGGESLLDRPLQERDMQDIPEQSEAVHLLFCGVDDSQELTDVIIYGAYDPKAGTARLLSIPRDTFLGDAYPTGKINQVYRAAGSMAALKEEVMGRFHLPVDYTVTITLNAVGEIVDALGGVPITIEQDIYDLGVQLFEAGEQVLNGEQAQLFVRQRHAYANADLGRIEAQQGFLLAVMDKVQSLGKLKALQLLMSNFDSVSTDMPLSRAISIAYTAFGITREDISFFTAPGEGKMNGSYAVYEIDREALAGILNAHFLQSPVEADALDFPQVHA